ncbi:MAG TPA: hypothetical protein VN461_22560 [Vicinamibacteria bacterium]|nr:hypothetical protein [Vicinamibacteria bacterium]
MTLFGALARGSGPGAPPAGASVVGLLLGIVANFWAQFGWVRATNFGGSDEWLIISLVSRGILSVPYANRPWVFLWTLPWVRIRPHDLAAYYVAETTYLALSGCLVFMICRLLIPRYPLLSFLAGVFSVVWAPLDFLRLDTVLLTGYSGFAFGTLLAILLLLQSWSGQSVPLLALGALVGLVTTRGIEGVVPFLAAAPLLLAWMTTDRSRRFWGWVTGWEAVVLLDVALVLVPFLRPSGPGSYQGSALGLDLNPANVAVRLLRLFGQHLLPLVTSPVRELAVPAVPIAVVVFAAAYALARRLGGAAPEGREALAPLAGLLGLGLLLAFLGYSLFMLSPSILTPARTQVLSSPGIGMVLAAGVGGAVSFLPARARTAGALLLGSWIVAVGAGRTVAMQKEWDESRSRFSVQHRTLAQLTRSAPRLKPHTLVVLIDEAKAWRATFTFRHAVEYLYPGEATGLVWGAEDFLYPAYFQPQGVLCVPWSILWSAWNSRPTAHRYEELLVVRLTEEGELSILEHWPEALPRLPAGAAYAPWSRVEGEGPLPPSRAILARGP